MIGIFLLGDTHRYIGEEHDSEDTKENNLNFMQIIISIVISLCSCTTGYTTSWTSPCIPSMMAPENSFSVSAEESSWIGSLVPLTAIIGAVLGGPLVEAFGRHTIIAFAAFPFFISFLMLAFANNISMIYGGRVLSGFFVGVCSLALPIYLGETMLPKVRGTLGLLPCLFGNGASVVWACTTLYCLREVLGKRSGEFTAESLAGMLLCCALAMVFNWRSVSLFGAIIPVVYFFGMFIIPETPQWYISRDRHRQGRRALRHLRGYESDICSEYALIERANQLERTDEAASLLTIFERKYTRPLAISLGLMFFQQMSGVNAFMYYTVSFFRETGGTIDHYTSTLIVNVVNIFSSLLATFFIDVVGRKVLLSVSSFIMAIMLFGMGTYFYYKARGEQMSSFTWVPLISLIMFIIGFSVGFGPIPWLMMGEVLPAKIRGAAASVGTAFNMLCAFLITKLYSSMLVWLGLSGCCLFYGIMCVFAFIFVVIVVPETKGLSLDDIEKSLTGTDKNITIRHVKRITAKAFIKPLPMAL